MTGQEASRTRRPPAKTEDLTMSFMKKTLCRSAGFCLLLTASAHALHGTDKTARMGREIACTYSQKGLMSSGEARLNLIGGKVSWVYFNIYFAGGVGAFSYACDIDWRRTDQSYAWQDTKSGTVIIIKETGDRVELVHDRKKKGYILNFTNLNRLSKWCGVGAEVPEEVFIPLSGKSCKITMPKRP